jgi:hypothetical protein
MIQIIFCIHKIVKLSSILCLQNESITIWKILLNFFAFAFSPLIIGAILLECKSEPLELMTKHFFINGKVNLKVLGSFN